MHSPATITIVLASTSSVRKRLLAAAGVLFTVIDPLVEEVALRAELKGTEPSAIAAALAFAKAAGTSARVPDVITIGADQVLEFDSRIFPKPVDPHDARRQLRMLRGKTHALHTAVCVAEAGRAEWQHEETARLTMHGFSDSFLEQYLERAGDALKAPGAYHLEDLGATLFERVEGDTFAILGLPLLPVLGFLRQRGALPQ